jgi:amidase
MIGKPKRIEGGGLIAMTAIEVVGLLRDGEVSSLDLLDALEHRIAAVDGAVGALPTLCMDWAHGCAKALLHESPVVNGAGG